MRGVAAALLVAALGSGCAAGGGEGAENSRGAPPPSHARPPSATPVPAEPAAGPAAAPPLTGSDAPGAGEPTASRTGASAEGGDAENNPAAGGPAGPAGALSAYADGLRGEDAGRAATARRWGLDQPPLVPPPPPVVKPKITTREGFEVEGGDAGLPPVFTTVPTTDKVVFLTIDDGSEKDPDFIRMMSDLWVPYTAFLSDYLISDDYGYFQDVQAQGVTLDNHTLTHPYLPSLSYEEQEREICGQQNRLAERYGKRPVLFRPPYGNYNADTLRIAQECGIEAVPLWEAEAFPDHMDWRDETHFEPGDIILTHFQGPSEWNATMPEVIRNLLNRITSQGYAVARLEDYV